MGGVRVHTFVGPDMVCRDCGATPASNTVVCPALNGRSATVSVNGGSGGAVGSNGSWPVFDPKEVERDYRRAAAALRDSVERVGKPDRLDGKPFEPSMAGFGAPGYTADTKVPGKPEDWCLGCGHDIHSPGECQLCTCGLHVKLEKSGQIPNKPHTVNVQITPEQFNDLAKPLYDTVAGALKDSGQRTEYATGAVRDNAVGRGRPDLISPIMLNRLAIHLEKGALKYAERNWERGLQIARCFASLWRHSWQAFMREEDEDHMAAVVCNAMFIIHLLEMIRRKRLPADLDNRPDYSPLAEG